MPASTSRDPRILFLTPGDIHRQTGGSHYNKKLAQGLIQRGFRVEVVVFPDLPYFIGLAAGLIVATAIFVRLARGKYDAVIEDNWAHPTTILFNLACRVTGKVPLIILVHQIRSSTSKPPIRFIVQVFERMALRSASLIVAVSDFIRAEVEGLAGSGQRIVVARPGSCLPIGCAEPREQSGAQPLKLLFVGNCTPLKGIDSLIAAMGLLDDIPIRLDIVGDVTIDPRHSERLRSRAAELRVSDRVIFHGAVPQEFIGRFYSTANMFTFPSLYEGFGIVLAEAMHAGLPIIATRIGPVGETVREGENALLVPPDEPAALAEAIRKLALDTVMREEYGRRSRHLAASLPTWQETCDLISDYLAIIFQTTRDKRQTTTRIPIL